MWLFFFFEQLLFLDVGQGVEFSTATVDMDVQPTTCSLSHSLVEGGILAQHHVCYAGPKLLLCADAASPTLTAAVPVLGLYGLALCHMPPNWVDQLINWHSQYCVFAVQLNLVIC